MKARQLGLAIPPCLKIIEPLILKTDSPDTQFEGNSRGSHQKNSKQLPDLTYHIKNIIEAKEVKLNNKIQLVNGLCDIRVPDLIGDSLTDPVAG